MYPWLRRKSFKLTDAQVLEIFNRRLAGSTNQSLADEFSVSTAHISYIANKKTRKHVLQNAE